LALAARLLYTFAVADSLGTPWPQHVPSADGDAYDQVAWMLVTENRFAVPYEQAALNAGIPDSTALGWERFRGRQSRQMGGFEYLTAPAGASTALYEPGYPFFLSLIYRLFGRNYIAVQVIQILLDSLAAVLLFRLTLRLLPTLAAMLAGLAYALYPWAWECAGKFLTEPLLLPLLIVAFYALDRALAGGRLWWALAAGLSLGAVYQVRMLLIVLLPVILGTLLIRRPPKVYRRMILACLGFTIALAPWVIRNRLLFGQWLMVPTRAGYNAWFLPATAADHPQIGRVGRLLGLYNEIHCRDLLMVPILPAVPEPERDRLLRLRAREFLAANPGYYATFSIYQMGRFWVGRSSPCYGGIFNLTYYLWTAMALLGAVLMWRHAQPVGWMIAFWALYVLAIAATSYDSERMRWPLHPVQAIFVGAALGTIWEKWLRKRGA
jgi:4-amino-4-deoxy-L-arabinose transferase-like glycosyltransferase